MGSNNTFKFVSDIRWEHFPTQTYGLGSLTTNAEQLNVNYNFFRLYGTLYKPVAEDLYLGAGYNLDYRYNISLGTAPGNTIADFQKYGLTTSSTSSGLNLDVLFDDRRNALNPLGGSYLNLTLTQNLTFLLAIANGRFTSWISANSKAFTKFKQRTCFLEPALANERARPLP